VHNSFPSPELTELNARWVKDYEEHAAAIMAAKKYPARNAMTVWSLRYDPVGHDASDSNIAMRNLRFAVIAFDDFVGVPSSLSCASWE
jgi:hypothetical protein